MYAGIDLFGMMQKPFSLAFYEAMHSLRKTLEIASFEHLLTTSLHGLVVAHAYAIPVRWVMTTRRAMMRTV